MGICTSFHEIRWAHVLVLLSSMHVANIGNHASICKYATVAVNVRHPGPGAHAVLTDTRLGDNVSNMCDARHALHILTSNDAPVQAMFVRHPTNHCTCEVQRNWIKVVKRRN